MDATAGHGTFGGTEPVRLVQALRSSSKRFRSSGFKGLGVRGLRVVTLWVQIFAGPLL